MINSNLTSANPISEVVNGLDLYNKGGRVGDRSFLAQIVRTTGTNYEVTLEAKPSASSTWGAIAKFDQDQLSNPTRVPYNIFVDYRFRLSSGNVEVQVYAVS